jgi:hypothetical protein
VDTASGSWIDLDDQLRALQPTTVPDANAPLLTTLLYSDPQTRASCLLVEFPQGWKRAAGTYSCAEHAIVLDGEIILDGITWTAGQGFVVPAGAVRTETYTPHGAVAVAWFGGTPRWTSKVDTSESASSGNPSGTSWVGDLGGGEVGGGEVDEVDFVGRRWRHNFLPLEEQDSKIISYQWPTL